MDVEYCGFMQHDALDERRVARTAPLLKRHGTYSINQDTRCAKLLLAYRIFQLASKVRGPVCLSLLLGVELGVPPVFRIF